MVLDQHKGKTGYLKLKRLFDILLSFAGLVIAFPLFLAIGLTIALSDGFPVLFHQIRIGLNGREFTMHKFRTMSVGHNGSSVTVRGEKRITPFGALLRKYKLDELPELWNIFKGDMSFVGPRPDVPGYADKLEGDDRLLLSVRPGLTGVATLKYANEEELLAVQDDPVYFNNHVLYPDKVRLNNNYVKHMSFQLDLKIIAFTLLGKKLKEEYFK